MQLQRAGDCGTGVPPVGQACVPPAESAVTERCLPQSPGETPAGPTGGTPVPRLRLRRQLNRYGLGSERAASTPFFLIGCGRISNAGSNRTSAQSRREVVRFTPSVVLCCAAIFTWAAVGAPKS